MRKSFNGLSALIRAELGQNPLSGQVFIFFNRQRDQVKLIHFEGDGFGNFPQASGKRDVRAAPTNRGEPGWRYRLA